MRGEGLWDTVKGVARGISRAVFGRADSSPSPFAAPPPGAARLDTWMADLAATAGTKRLADLAIPGAHDAATSTISWKSSIAEGQGLPPALNSLRYVGVGFAVSGVIAGWSRAQSASIGDLLRMGVRYLDLRLVRNPSDRQIWTAHGLYGEPLAGVLSQVRAFLAASPKEVVILDIQDFGNIAAGERGAVVQSVASAFGPQVASNPEAMLQAPLSAIMAGPERILLLSDDDGPFARKRWMASPWWNSQSVAEFSGKLASYMASYKPSKPLLNCIQAILTPNGDTIKAGFLSGGPASLEAFSSLLLPTIASSLAGWIGRTGGSIVMVDYADAALCSAIVAQNGSVAAPPAAAPAGAPAPPSLLPAAPPVSEAAPAAEAAPEGPALSPALLTGRGFFHVDPGWM